MLSLRDLSVGYYKDLNILQDLNIDVRERQIAAILGANGVGKSTALKVIAGIYRPTAGRVVVNGKLSALLELGAGFHGELTGRENIVLNASILGLSRKQIDPDALTAAIAKEETRGVHGPQRGPVSITQATEKGTIYTCDEIAAIAAVTRRHGLKLHMDGARFANALVRLGCTPAEMTWKAGVDAVSFGGTKNGLMGVEAAVIFDPAAAREFELRRKRGAHLFSKHRYLAAQMGAYLEDDLWLDLARAANDACDRLAQGLRRVEGARFHFPPQANIIFAEWSRAAHRRLHEAGAQYYLWSGSLEDGPADETLTARLVTDWSASAEGIDRFLALARG